MNKPDVFITIPISPELKYFDIDSSMVRAELDMITKEAERKVFDYLKENIHPNQWYALRILPYSTAKFSPVQIGINLRPIIEEKVTVKTLDYQIVNVKLSFRERLKYLFTNKLPERYRGVK